MCPTEFPANLVWQPASSRTGSSKWWRFGGLFWSQSVYMSQNKTNWCCPEAFKVHRTPQNVLFRKSDDVEDVKVFQFLMIKTCDKLPIVSQHHVRLEKKDGDGITAQIWANSSCSAAEPRPSELFHFHTHQLQDGFCKEVLVPEPGTWPSAVWCWNMSKHNGKAENKKRQQEVAWDESQFLEFIQTM